MSRMEDKQQPPPTTGGPARRAFADLLTAWGGVREEGLREQHQVVSICPMDVRTYWLHDGSGRWSAKAAMYRMIEPTEAELASWAKTK